MGGNEPTSGGSMPSLHASGLYDPEWVPQRATLQAARWGCLGRLSPIAMTQRAWSCSKGDQSFRSSLRTLQAYSKLGDPYHNIPGRAFITEPNNMTSLRNTWLCVRLAVTTDLHSFFCSRTTHVVPDTSFHILVMQYWKVRGLVNKDWNHDYPIACA